MLPKSAARNACLTRLSGEVGSRNDQYHVKVTVVNTGVERGKGLCLGTRGEDWDGGGRE